MESIDFFKENFEGKYFVINKEIIIPYIKSKNPNQKNLTKLLNFLKKDFDEIKIVYPSDVFMKILKGKEFMKIEETCFNALWRKDGK